MPAEPSPNTSVSVNAQNQWNLDNRSAFANGAAGSVSPAQLWMGRLRRAQLAGDPFARYRKANTSSPIRFEKRPGDMGGAIVTLRSQGQLGGAGKRGDQLFAAKGDFGTIPLKEWNIYLDMVSQGAGVSPFAEEMLGLKDELNKDIPEQLGSWFGFYLKHHTDMTLMHLSAASSRSVINGKTVATLKSTDTIGYEAISNAGGLMADQGGRPFRAGVNQNGGEELWNMLFQLPQPHLQALKKDPGWKSRYADAGIRGKDNVFFDGVFDSLDGHQIVPRTDLVPQGQLCAGSAWAPIAYLGAAQVFVDAGTYGTLKGGGAFYNSGDTSVPYFQNFPGWTFPWNQINSLALADSFWGGLIASAGPWCALVVNPSTGTDAGKVGMIKYTVDANANTLTVVGRLHGSDTDGANDTTVGNVTVASLEAAGAQFTADYQIGAAVIPCNADGVPIGAFYGLCADAVGFVRGNNWGERFREPVTGGLHGFNTYAGWTFGQNPYVLPSGATPGISVTACAVSYEGRYKLPRFV